MNPTIHKFGWPETQIADLEHWVVLLRPEQPVLGALVLACKQPVTSFGDVDPAGMAELGMILGAIERMLAHAIGYEKINYLMLMMVDPDVHFHVLPRYDGTRQFEDTKIADHGWPGPPDLQSSTTLPPDQRDRLIAHLQKHWSL